MFSHPLAFISNLGGSEILIILLIILILFGSKRIPELARGLGQAFNEFKKAKDDFDHEIQKTSDELKVREPKDKQEHKLP